MFVHMETNGTPSIALPPAFPSDGCWLGVAAVAPFHAVPGGANRNVEQEK